MRRAGRSTDQDWVARIPEKNQGGETKTVSLTSLKSPEGQVPPKRTGSVRGKRALTEDFLHPERENLNLFTSRGKLFREEEINGGLDPGIYHPQYSPFFHGDLSSHLFS